jgi:hypothetical protein
MSKLLLPIILTNSSKESQILIEEYSQNVKTKTFKRANIYDNTIMLMNNQLCADCQTVKYENRTLLYAKLRCQSND